jgi:dihydroorotate dehydrogenase (NAD+) catalytic subunit
MKSARSRACGLTGATVKPVILRMVYQCARAVTLPVVGCGGIFSVEDAVEYMLAGAAAVQVGTANFIHPTTMIDIIPAQISGAPRLGRGQPVDRCGAGGRGCRPAVGNGRLTQRPPGTMLD